MYTVQICIINIIYFSRQKKYNKNGSYACQKFTVKHTVTRYYRMNYWCMYVLYLFHCYMVLI